MSDYRHRSGVDEEALDRLGRRLAAAYVSYMAGRKGVDSTLKQCPDRIGQFWIDLADILFCAAQGKSVDDDDLRLADVITKYTQ